MCNGKVYKRLCAIAVSLGVVLSVGQYSYAHNLELSGAEADAKINPTMATLGRLYDLYKKDVEYHKSKGEYDEAQKSEAGLLWTRKQQLEIMAKDSCEKAEQARVIADNDKIPDNYRNEAKYRIQAASLFTAAGNAKAAADAKENAAKCWEDAAALETKTGNLAQSKAYTKIANAIKPHPANVNKTLTDYENEIKRLYDNIISAEASGESFRVKHYEILAKIAIKKTVNMVEKLANTDRW